MTEHTSANMIKMEENLTKSKNGKDSNANNEFNDTDEDGNECEDGENENASSSCGIGSWRPTWLQYFASAKFFAMNFAIVGILQGAMFTYTIGIISTIEKRYAFESKVSGFILIADNLSGMIISPVVGYLGSKYNRSRLIASGELVVALSALMNIIPFLLYGPGLHLINQDTAAGNSSGLVSTATTAPSAHLFCEQTDDSLTAQSCAKGEQATVKLAVFILWISSFANGLGYTAFYTIGLPYIDDNIAKKNSAMYLSWIATLRLLGPTLGFLLSSFCLRLYEDPFMTPNITNTDPRWIGAWWLGFIILGAAILICTVPMFMFPKQLKVSGSSSKSRAHAVSTAADGETDGAQIATRTPQSIAKANTPKFDGALKSLGRLVRNKLFILHVFAGIFRIIGYLGYYIFKPKYMELQYKQTASSASFFTGASSVVSMAIGTMAGGVFIRYAKPRARYLLLFVCAMELVSTSGIFTSMFLQCPTPLYPAVAPLEESSGAIASSCNAHCECSTKVFRPVCGADAKSHFFSPCFAGCQSFDETNQTFAGCSCSEQLAGDSWATPGACETDCNRFPIYIAVFSLCNLIGSTARTADTLIMLRAVQPRDKSFAMGITGSAFAIFAFTPYPLIFGAIIDSACLVWERACGQTGNCWLYDIDRFRVLLHSAALTFIAIGITLEFIAVLFADQITNMYADEEEEEEGEEQDGEAGQRLKPLAIATAAAVAQIDQTDQTDQ